MTDKQRVQGDQFVLINKVDAKNRNVKSGDKVKVFFNERGSFDAVTEVSNDVSPGIVVATLGYWRQLNRGTVNSISSAKLADMGNAPTFSDNLVEVEKI